MATLSARRDEHRLDGGGGGIHLLGEDAPVETARNRSVAVALAVIAVGVACHLGGCPDPHCKFHRKGEGNV